MFISAARGEAHTLTRGLVTIGQAMLLILIRCRCISGSLIDGGSVRADRFVARGALVNDILPELNRAD
jgi:hypothetical protein